MLHPLDQKISHSLGSILSNARPGAILVAVSGGPDSIALLRSLARIGQEDSRSHLHSSMTRIHVAHFDHLLRVDSRLDAAYVKDAANVLGLPITIGSGDVRGYAIEQNLGIEEAARETRYRFFAYLAQEIGAWGVAIGHTADDQAETILLHLARGSGLTGLRGMVPISLFERENTPPLRVLRPMLEVSRAEVIDYLASQNIEYRTDPSNQSFLFTRNRVRHEVLPALRRVNPRIVESLNRLGQMASDDDDHLEEETARDFWRLSLPHDPSQPDSTTLEGSDETIVLSRPLFRILHPSLQRRILRYSYRKLLGAQHDLSADNVEKARLLTLGKRVSASLDWPRDIVFFIRSQTLSLCHLSAFLSHEDSRVVAFIGLSEPTALEVPGTTRLPDGLGAIDSRVISDACGEGLHPFHAHFDLDGIDGLPFIRTRQPGDRIRPLGLNGTKKLQDILIDAKVPIDQRDRVPLLCDREGILWVCGLRRSERSIIEKETTSILCLRYHLGRLFSQNERE